MVNRTQQVDPGDNTADKAGDESNIRLEWAEKILTQSTSRETLHISLSSPKMSY